MMAGNDDWQRDQWERERGYMGIATGSEANSQALADRAAQERLTKTIQENLDRQSAIRYSQQKTPIAQTMQRGWGGHIDGSTPTIPSTALIVASAALAAGIAFLFTGGELVMTSAVAVSVGVVLLGLRALYRSKVFDMALKAAFVGAVVGYMAMLAILALGTVAGVVYLVWEKEGPETAMWLVVAIVTFVGFLGLVHFVRARYLSFKATPGGKRFGRNLARVRLAILLGASVAGLWWLATAFQLL